MVASLFPLGLVQIREGGGADFGSLLPSTETGPRLNPLLLWGQLGLQKPFVWVGLAVLVATAEIGIYTTPLAQLEVIST